MRWGRRLSNRKRFFASSSSGQAMVEGAFVLLLFFVFMFAIFEAGRLLQVRQALTDAAREGARRSIAPMTQTLPGVLPTEADVKSVVKNYLRAAHITVTDGQITVDQNVGSTVKYTRVTVTYPYRIMTLKMFGMMNINVTGSSLMRNETSPD